MSLDGCKRKQMSTVQHAPTSGVSRKLKHIMMEFENVFVNSPGQKTLDTTNSCNTTTQDLSLECRRVLTALVIFTSHPQ